MQQYYKRKYCLIFRFITSHALKADLCYKNACHLLQSFEMKWCLILFAYESSSYASFKSNQSLKTQNNI
jgi:hypothetical protein